MVNFDKEINQALDIAEEMMPRTAKIVAILRDEFVKNGFTREEAIALCSNYKVGGQ